MNETQKAINERVKRNRERYAKEYKIWWNSVHKIVEQTCIHSRYPKHVLAIVDNENGFEITNVSCSNCRKTLGRQIRRLNRPQKPKRPRRGF